MNNNIYLDTNSIINLWKWYQKYNKEGSSKDQNKNNPFNNVLLSSYNIDELITFDPKDDKRLINVLKSNLSFLLIFNKLPVLKGSSELINIKDIISNDYSECKIDRNKINTYLFQRLIDTVSGSLIKQTKEDIEKKAQAQKYWYIQQFDPLTQKLVFTPKDKRKTLQNIIDSIKVKLNLKNPITFTQFYNLCMNLYVAKRKKQIISPIKSFYNNQKDTKKALNEQYDFYHLTYMFFCKKFVTNDKALLEIAKCLSSNKFVNCEIYTEEEFFKSWLRESLSNIR